MTPGIRVTTDDTLSSLSGQSFLNKPFLDRLNVDTLKLGSRLDRLNSESPTSDQPVETAKEEITHLPDHLSYLLDRNLKNPLRVQSERCQRCLPIRTSDTTPFILPVLQQS